MCLDRARTHAAKARAKALETGLCRCGRPVSHGGATQCIFCIGRRRARQRERLHRLNEAGICRCGKEIEDKGIPQAVACHDCLTLRFYRYDQIREKRIQRQEAEDIEDGCGPEAFAAYAQARLEQAVKQSGRKKRANEDH